MRSCGNLTDPTPTGFGSIEGNAKEEISKRSWDEAHENCRSIKTHGLEVDTNKSGSRR